VPNFIAISLRGAFPQICEIRFCDFFVVLSCPACPGYTFFSQLCPARTPGRILTIYGLNDASSPKDVPFGGFDDYPQYLGVQILKNPKKGPWLGIFQPNLQNYKIVISPVRNNGSIPYFDVVIEPHS